MNDENLLSGDAALQRDKQVRISRMARREIRSAAQNLRLALRHLELLKQAGLTMTEREIREDELPALEEALEEQVLSLLARLRPQLSAPSFTYGFNTQLTDAHEVLERRPDGSLRLVAFVPSPAKARAIAMILNAPEE